MVRIDAAAVARHGRSRLPAQPARRHLYDLEADPGEHHDLLTGKAPPGVEDALWKALRDHVSAQEPRSAQAVIDVDTVERLRSLGYVEDK